MVMAGPMTRAASTITAMKAGQMRRARRTRKAPPLGSRDQLNDTRNPLLTKKTITPTWPRVQASEGSARSVGSGRATSANEWLTMTRSAAAMRITSNTGYRSAPPPTAGHCTEVEGGGAGPPGRVRGMEVEPIGWVSSTRTVPVDDDWD